MSQSDDFAYTQIDATAFRGCLIFCSSPYYLRHALTLHAHFGPLLPTQLWRNEQLPLAGVFASLKLETKERNVWPAQNSAFNLSRPWSVLQVRLQMNRVFRALFRDTRNHLIFYEGDYPEPMLQSLIRQLTLRNTVFRFANAGHDTVTATGSVSLQSSLRAFSARLAYGYRIRRMSRPGLTKGAELLYFDSLHYKVQRVQVEPDATLIAPLVMPLPDTPFPPRLILLESAEQDSYHDFDITMNALLQYLRGKGWRILIKPHPRLGCSPILQDSGETLLDGGVPLEFYDLRSVSAVLGFCSSAMFETANAGVPTYSIEKLFQRRNPMENAWAIQYLTADRNLNLPQASIHLPESLSQLPVPGEAPHCA